MNKTAIILAACGLVTLEASAKNLTLKGNGTSPAVWNTSNEDVWVREGTTTFAKFAYGDNVTIDDTFTGDAIQMSARVTPGNVVFDISKSLRFGFSWNGTTCYGLGLNTGSFVKRGTGTLLISNYVTGADGENSGNVMTCGVDVVEGEIAITDRGTRNLLGWRERPFTVRVRDGAALSFLNGNQNASHNDTVCGIRVQLDAGSTLNHCTNAVNENPSSVLNLGRLRLNGGDIVWGNTCMGDANVLGKKSDGNTAYCLMNIFNALEFGGATPIALGMTKDGFKSYRPIIPSKPNAVRFFALSNSTKGPSIELQVDDITGDDRTDVCIDMSAFTWGKDSDGLYRRSFLKTGAGTLSFPLANETLPFLGDFTIAGGTVEFTQQGFFKGPDTDRPVQTLTVSNNATLRMTSRNVVSGGTAATPKLDVVVDHATFEFRTTSTSKGWMKARRWMFNEATIVISNGGQNKTDNGVLGFFERVDFKGTKPYDLAIDKSVGDAYEGIHFGYAPRTEVYVDDVTGDGATDVTFGMHLRNMSDNNSGFIKKGAGTLSVGNVENTLAGEVTVSNGTLRVDGVLTTPSAVTVAGGGLIGGTGTVARVTMEEGAGFAARASEKGALLTINGDLALPANGVVVLDAPAGQVNLVGMKLATVTGTLTGTANLDGWTLKDTSGNVVRTSGVLVVRGSDICLRSGKGMAIIFR